MTKEVVVVILWRSNQILQNHMDQLLKSTAVAVYFAHKLSIPDSVAEARKLLRQIDEEIGQSKKATIGVGDQIISNGQLQELIDLINSPPPLTPAQVKGLIGKYNYKKCAEIKNCHLAQITKQLQELKKAPAPSYIDETQRKELVAIATGKGLTMGEAKDFLREVGYEKSSAIPSDCFAAVKRRFMELQPDYFWKSVHDAISWGCHYYKLKTDVEIHFKDLEKEYADLECPQGTDRYRSWVLHIFESCPD